MAAKELKLLPLVVVVVVDVVTPEDGWPVPKGQRRNRTALLLLGGCFFFKKVVVVVVSDEKDFTISTFRSTMTIAMAMCSLIRGGTLGGGALIRCRSGCAISLSLSLSLLFRPGGSLIKLLYCVTSLAS